MLFRSTPRHSVNTSIPFVSHSNDCPDVEHMNRSLRYSSKPSFFTPCRHRSADRIRGEAQQPPSHTSSTCTRISECSISGDPLHLHFSSRLAQHHRLRSSQFQLANLYLLQAPSLCPHLRVMPTHVVHALHASGHRLTLPCSKQRHRQCQGNFRPLTLPKPVQSALDWIKL